MKSNGSIQKVVGSVEVYGNGPLCKDRSIRMDMLEGGKVNLHLWSPDLKTGGRRGTRFNRLEALRAYALGLLEMAERFEVEARPVWEAAGGRWLSEEEQTKASGLHEPKKAPKDRSP